MRLSVFECKPAGYSTGADEPANSPTIQASLIEPLSTRELKVLRLIAEGLSNLAIAQRLYLSLGTVKVHIKHMYGKLDVNSRTQAVVRLRARADLSFEDAAYRAMWQKLNAEAGLTGMPA